MFINTRLLAMGGMIEEMLLHYTLLNCKYIYMYIPLHCINWSVMLTAVAQIVSIRHKKCQIKDWSVRGCSTVACPQINKS